MNLSTLQRTKNRLFAKAFTAFPSLAARWGERMEAEAGHVEIPWTTVEKPLSQARVALVTTGGVHHKDQPPFDMADKQGDATWRAIHISTPQAELEITHDYYNQTDARNDLNLVLPVQRLRELEKDGVIGSLYETAVSFMGHIDGPHLETLKSDSAREVAALLREGEVDYALLVPA